MNFGKTFTTLGTVAALGLAPEIAEAGNHHNHAVLSFEGGQHGAMIHGGYFREVAGHLSVGVTAGLGKGFHGENIGSLGAMVAYHKTISRRVARGVFGVIEGGFEAEAISDTHGSTVEPAVKATVLGGVQVTDSLGVFLGGNYKHNLDVDDWSGSAGAVLSF